MINLLLVLLMIAALAGMVLCGRFRQKRPALQLIALLLLVLVVVSGAMFMSRTGALTLLGISEQEVYDDAARKLDRAHAYVVVNYLKTAYPKCQKVLIVGPQRAQSRAQILLEELAMQGYSDFTFEAVQPLPASRDQLITDDADQAAAGSAIDAIIARHPEAQAIVLIGFGQAEESLAHLKVYRIVDSRRPKIIVLGLTRIGEWAAEQIRSGIFSAVVVTDLAKSADLFAEPLPNDPEEAFQRRYQLITRENLNRNRRFLH